MTDAWERIFSSYFHLLGFAFLFWAILGRGKSLKALQVSPHETNLRALFYFDRFVNATLIVSVGTGLYRAFSSLEKGTDYYLKHPYFHLKLTLVVLFLLFELYPKVVFFKWKSTLNKGTLPLLPLENRKKLKLFSVLNHVNLLLLTVAAFCGSVIARSFFGLS